MNDDASGVPGGTPYLIVPRGRKELSPLNLDMREIYRIEGRIQDISTANPATMPDLISDFNRGYAMLGGMVAKVQLELSEAEIALREAKSIALLDKVDKVLSEKGQKSSADLRDAVVQMDQDVKEASRRVSVLEAYLTLLNNKAKSFEMAYHGTKKVSEIQARIPDGNTMGRGTY
jgi:hypothetical protein